MKEDIAAYINDFITSYLLNVIDTIDNEAGLQFNLGLFFKEKGFNVSFERNVFSYIEPKKNEFVKKEMDLVLEKDNKKYAIEIKKPFSVKNKNRMESTPSAEVFEMLKDIKFMEQVKKCCQFEGTFAFCLTDSKRKGDKFVSKFVFEEQKSEWLYPFFRKKKYDDSNKINAEYEMSKAKLLECSEEKKKDIKNIIPEQTHQITWNRFPVKENKYFYYFVEC